MKRGIFIAFLIVIMATGVLAVQENTYDEAKIKVELINVNPSPVHQGKSFSFDLKVTNYGDKNLQNIKFSFVNKYPFNLNQDDYVDKYINFLGSGDSTTVNFKVDANSAATIGINEVNVQFYVPLTKQTYSYGFDIDVKALTDIISLDEAKTDPERIQPGQEADLTITLKNDADSVMNDIRVRLDFSGVPLSPVNSFSDRRIVSLDKGQSTDVNFKIIADADAESKPYKLPVNIEFYDRNGELKNRNGTIGVIVDALPEFQLDLEDTKVYTAGQSGEVVVSMSNIGPGNLKFVSLELLESDNYDVISNRRVYLGNLESDDFETAEYNIFVKNTKDDEIPLKLKVNYKNNFNENFDDIREVNLKLFSKGEATKFGLTTPSGGAGYLYIIILIIFGYYFIIEWRKHRNIPKALKIVVMKFFRKIGNLLRFIFRRRKRKK